MAASAVSCCDCNIEAHLYRNEDRLVGVRGSSSWNSQAGVAVTECEQGETLEVRTNENTCHDIHDENDDRRVNWFSAVLIAMT